MIYTVFAEQDDMTFIMRDVGEDLPPKCVGWYFGEPNDKDTATFTDTLQEVNKD